MIQTTMDMMTLPIPPVTRPGMSHRTATHPVRIGLIVASTLESKTTLALAQWARAQPFITMAGLIIQAPARSRDSAGSAVWSELSLSLLSRLEGLALRRHPKFRHHRSRFDLRTLGANTLQIETSDASACLAIGALELDLLVCLDPHVETTRLADLAGCTRLGILAVRTGLGSERSPGPAGFWEVAMQRDVTTFAIEHAPGATPGAGNSRAWRPNTLYRGAFATRFHFLLNQAALCELARYAMQGVLSQVGTHMAPASQALLAPQASPGAFDSLASMGSGFEARMLGPDCGPTLGYPDLAAQLRYGRSLVGTLWRKWRNKYLLKNNYRWGVAFRPQGWQNLVMHRALPIQNPPGHFLADPFILSSDQQSYCYVEDYDYAQAKACISVYELQNDRAVRIGPVIQERFHLSFPFLFRYQSRHYLCPESSAAREIRLYECAALPDQWRLKKILMSNIAAADTMLFEHEGRWWMLTNIDSAGIGDYCSELHLFYAQQPVTDAWTPHPLNPVIVDPNRARNGGLLFDGPTIYRVSQRQGFDAYGKAAGINRITVLSPSDYREEVVAAITPDFFPNLKGTHHLHSDGRFTVFDYQY
jgi:hypothetical protein